MTSTVAQGITNALPGTPGLALAAPAGGILALLLIVLLIARILVQVAAIPRWQAIVRTIDVAVVPLVVAFGAILYARFQEILPLG